MDMITISEFEKEMSEIENLIDKVSEILNSNIFVKMFRFGEAVRLHNEAGERMDALFQKRLVE